MVLKWVAAAAAVVIVVGLWAFEPWRLFTSSEIDEPLPTPVVATTTPSKLPSAEASAPSAPAEPSSSPSAPAAPSPSAPAPTATPEPEPELVELARGDFEDAEHGTSGVARVIELSDGSRFVRLEDLASSDGPDLFVWITDQPSGGAWGSYDDGRYVGLGELKATNGNQNYEIPADADLSGMTSVVIWCDRFDVAFGTAPITIS